MNVSKSRFAASVVFGLAVSPILVNCGQLPNVPGADKLPSAGNCPDMANVDAIMAFDFGKEFKLQGDVGAKIKGGVASAVDLKGVAASIDADLKAGCGGLAKDLGATGDFKDGTAACEAAVKAMGDIKAKMGGKIAISLNVKPPVCSADMNVMADCAAKCDANVKPGSAKVECEPGKLSGSCSAKCEGSCDMNVAAKCDGACSGTCDAEMKGTCSGKCNGKCDGKASNGAACAGTCEGKCDAQVKGDCRGKCGGSCELKAGAKCDGTCTGKCSAEMTAPKCTGEVKPPEMSADCKGHCDAKVNAHLDCKPASVGVVVTGAADAKAADQYKMALEKNLPLVLKVAIGMGDRAAKMAGNVKAVVEGAQAGVQSASDPMMTAKLTACVAAPLKGALDAAASVKASVDVSVNVKASASASGSASTK